MTWGQKGLRTTVAACLIVWSTGAFADEPAGRLMTLEDLHNVQDVSEPAISPDGETVAYVVSKHDLKRDAIISDVWLVPYAGGTPKQITKADEKSESTPRFSPDGKTIAWLGADKDGNTQVFVRTLKGSKAKQVTRVKGGILEYDWSPDGKQMVVSAFVGGAEPNEAGTTPPIVIDRFQFKEDWVGYLAGARRHLLVIDVVSGKENALTSGDQDHWLPAWSPDGKWIAYVSKDQGDADRNMDSDVFIIPANGSGTAKRISSFKGTDVDPYWMSPPAWSPDSKKLAWLQSGESKWIYYASWQLTVADIATGENRPLAHVDRNFYTPEWSADGGSIYTLLEGNRSTWLVKIDAESGKMEKLSDGDRFALAFALSGNDRAVLLDSTDDKPFEVYAVEDTLRQLSDHNTWLEDVRLGETQEFSFDGPGGRIDGLLLLPPGASTTDKLPTIFRLHGGPVYQFSHEFMSDWQIYAAQGYAVVGINPRGSSGRGFDFARAIYADWGNVDVADILAGTDYLAAQGTTDPERMGVGGWSYGGMLTDYVIGRDTRFKAAISGAGTANMFGTYGHDQYSREYELELGTPWDNREAYERVSYPFLHANGIKTPTMFQCAEMDFNVPCIGAEQMYQALRSVGTPTRLVIYPGQHHGLVVPSYLGDRMKRNLEWYDMYLKPGGSQ
ncbi:dipeptidyl-peptidase 5 [Kordiimonas gwangyangensis]|uniref:dipeptidyl-peptidase 5 n=1 Tax=Kordiimonas gwangyangensis TaxID=288022 RepID=UPI0003A3788D|nr:S9 family peptidase [Kordiimonas gwangyangensis]